MVYIPLYHNLTQLSSKVKRRIRKHWSLSKTLHNTLYILQYASTSIYIIFAIILQNVQEF